MRLVRRREWIVPVFVVDRGRGDEAVMVAVDEDDEAK